MVLHEIVNGGGEVGGFARAVHGGIKVGGLEPGMEAFAPGVVRDHAPGQGDVFGLAAGDTFFEPGLAQHFGSDAVVPGVALPGDGGGPEMEGIRDGIASAEEVGVEREIALFHEAHVDFVGDFRDEFDTVGMKRLREAAGDEQMIVGAFCGARQEDAEEERDVEARQNFGESVEEDVVNFLAGPGAVDGEEAAGLSADARVRGRLMGDAGAWQKDEAFGVILLRMVVRLAGCAGDAVIDLGAPGADGLAEKADLNGGDSPVGKQDGFELHGGFGEDGHLKIIIEEGGEGAGVEEAGDGDDAVEHVCCGGLFAEVNEGEVVTMTELFEESAVDAAAGMAIAPGGGEDGDFVGLGAIAHRRQCVMEPALEGGVHEGFDGAVGAAADVGGAVHDVGDLEGGDEGGVMEVKVFAEIFGDEWITDAGEEGGVFGVPAGGEIGVGVEEGLAVDLDPVACGVEGEDFDEV